MSKERHSCSFHFRAEEEHLYRYLVQEANKTETSVAEVCRNLVRDSYNGTNGRPDRKKSSNGNSSANKPQKDQGNPGPCRQHTDIHKLLQEIKSQVEHQASTDGQSAFESGGFDVFLQEKMSQRLLGVENELKLLSRRLKTSIAALLAEGGKTDRDVADQWAAEMFD